MTGFKAHVKACAYVDSIRKLSVRQGCAAKPRRTLRQLVLASLVCLAQPASAVLPASITSALKSAGIAESQIALWSAPAAGGPPSLQHNATEAFNPASVMKLVTSSAALELLGPSFTWRTEAYLQGEVRDGALWGDLVLRGGGDPALTWDRFGIFLRELRSRGLREIRGDLIIDRSLFAATDPAPFDDEPLRAYNATPDAFLLNFKTISVRLNPAAPALPIRATLLTPFTPFSIDNRLVATSAPCGDWRRNMQLEYMPQAIGMRLKLSGTMPASCGEKQLNLAMQDGLQMTAGVFRALWTELGGTLEGKVRDGIAPTGVAPFAVWQSPSLAEVLRDMNKFSNNVMARHLFLTLGIPPGNELPVAVTPAMAERKIREWLAMRQLLMPALTLENGSGLSRKERISASGLGQLLQSMWQSPRMPDLVATLPIAGEDGTAKRRFGGQAVSGRAYLKTGSLNDVMSTAGFVQDAAGQWQVVVLMIAGPHAEQAEAATQEALRIVREGRETVTFVNR